MLRTGDVMASPSAPSISEPHLNGPHDSGSPLAELENPHNQILNLNGNGKVERDVVVPNGEGHEDESVEEEDDDDDEGSETEGETTVEDVKGKGRVAEVEGHDSVAESAESAQDDDEEADDDEQEEEEDDSEPVLKYEPLPVSLSDLLKRDSLSAHALSPHSIVRLSSTLIQIYTHHPHRHWEHTLE